MGEVIGLILALEAAVLVLEDSVEVAVALVVVAPLGGGK